MTMMWQCHLSSSECRCYRLNGFSLFKRLPIPLSSGSRALEQSVGEWLESIGLQQYESKLLLNGFDDVRFLVSAADAAGWPETGPPSWSVKEYTIPYPGGVPAEGPWAPGSQLGSWVTADCPGPTTCARREHRGTPCPSHSSPVS